MAQQVWDDARNGYSRCQDENVAMAVCLIAWRGRPRRAISRAAHMHELHIYQSQATPVHKMATIGIVPIWYEYERVTLVSILSLNEPSGGGGDRACFAPPAI